MAARLTKEAACAFLPCRDLGVEEEEEGEKSVPYDRAGRGERKGEKREEKRKRERKAM
jgi:hypothetical protein